VAAVFYAVRDEIDINRSHASGEIDRWIDEASADVLRRILKIETRKHHEVRTAEFNELKSKLE
jgi:hypothetical protein